MTDAGRVCVVTGASSGIGHRTALDLAGEGARVVVAARRKDRLESLVEEMGGEAAGHSFHVTDVSQRDQVQALARHVEETYGRCDVLVNNAGRTGSGRFRGPESVANVEEVMAVNFFGAVYCTAELLPLLERSAPAFVVNVASVAGRVAPPGESAYCASKFALIGWSEGLEVELERRGVCISTIEPGFVPTEGFPHKDLQANPVMSRLIGSDEDVSRAIRHAISKRKHQRTVPRFYYLVQIPRVLAPGPYRFLRDKALQGVWSRR
jgi:NAD(P)-dependent dehydrogenase (short-subunit alcohol dehydrogenase family)